jgi:hypothetical protein
MVESNDARRWRCDSESWFNSLSTTEPLKVTTSFLHKLYKILFTSDSSRMVINRNCIVNSGRGGWKPIRMFTSEGKKGFERGGWITNGYDSGKTMRCHAGPVRTLRRLLNVLLGKARISVYILEATLTWRVCFLQHLLHPLSITTTFPPLHHTGIPLTLHLRLYYLAAHL